MQRLILPLMVALGIIVATAAEATSGITVTAVTVEIAAIIEQSGRGVTGEPVDTNALRRVYGAVGNAPLWHLDPDAASRRQALEAAITGAAEQALPPDGFHLDALANLGSPTTAREVAERDVLLTDALLHYAGALRHGAVDPSALGTDWHIAREPDDVVAGLIAALRNGGLTDFLAGLAPRDRQYARLVDALRQYRTLAADGGWAALPGRDELKLDGHDPRIVPVRDRLVAEGYMPSAGPGTLGDIMGAVRAFQTHHGLEADARIGQRTLAALNVSAEERVQQIAANLERRRHLPHQLGTRYVAVNVADASLDLIENGTSIFHTRVIVGDQRHPSPTLRATITAVTFNPPWNVPPSIAVKEMLPRLRRNPGYLAANDIVIVGRSDDPFGLHVDWRRLSAHPFPFRLQQRPGLKNSLGALKLEMANPWDVYLHDTPAKALFEHAARGFSHGCIRVQQPSELARLLLDDPAWDAEAIAQGMAAGRTRSVALRRPVPVYVLYATAFVDAEGAVNFRDDIYDRDLPIERALHLDRVPANANQLQPMASCDQPAAAVALQMGG